MCPTDAQTLREQFEGLLVSGVLRIEDVTTLLGLANSAAQPWLDEVFSGVPGDKDSTIDVDAFIRFLETGELVFFSFSLIFFSCARIMTD